MRYRGKRSTVDYNVGRWQVLVYRSSAFSSSSINSKAIWFSVDTTESAEGGSSVRRRRRVFHGIYNLQDTGRLIGLRIDRCERDNGASLLYIMKRQCAPSKGWGLRYSFSTGHLNVTGARFGDGCS